MTPMVVLLICLLAMVGAVLWQWGRHQQRKVGLPSGAVVYQDTGAERAVTAPLISRRYGLVGKPDYLVEAAQQGRRTMIPVEVKSQRKPVQPLETHVLQLAAYCLIVEDFYGEAPAYGILRYADGAFTVPFTAELRRAVLDAAARIRTARTAAALPRSHQEPARCHRCGYRTACGERSRLA